MNLITKSTVLLASLLTYTQVSLANPVTVKEILKTEKSWDGSALPGFSSGKPEFKVLTFEIEPGAKTPIHLHPSNGAGYVLSGELTMFSTSDPHGSFSDPAKVKEIKLKAGDAWAEAVNIWHYGENKGHKKVKFIVAFAGQEGVPPTMSLSAAK